MAKTKQNHNSVLLKRKKIIWSYQLQPYDVYIQQKTETADSRAPEEKLQLIKGKALKTEMQWKERKGTEKIIIMIKI